MTVLLCLSFFAACVSFAGRLYQDSHHSIIAINHNLTTMHEEVKCAQTGLDCSYTWSAAKVTPPTQLRHLVLKGSSECTREREHLGVARLHSVILLGGCLHCSFKACHLIPEIVRLTPLGLVPPQCLYPTTLRVLALARNIWCY